MVEKALERGALIAGRYRLERLLGEGGMATVWEATHMVTRRVVAMKFLRDTLRNKPELRLRFLIEASAASALSHPNVVEILDVFDAEEQLPVMVMELLRGETLGQKLERDERLGLEETATLLLPVISAVGTAHALGIVHRDLKPDNVFLASTDAGIVVKVLDFGIAKLTAGHHADHGAPALRTVTGSILGTPSYMAPEQATGDAPIDHRADVWSIGVMLYECLSGTRPIEGENIAQVMARLVTAGIIPLERIAPELPDEVSATVSKMLTRDSTLRTPDLRDAFALLARHTRAKAPGFAAPATGETAASVEVLGAPPVSSSKWAATDPRAPTLLSPAISSSVTVTTGRRVLAARRSPLFAVAFIALVGGALALTLWLLRGSSAVPAEALATAPEAIPAPPPAHAVPGAPPTEGASPSTPLPPPSAAAQKPPRSSPKAPARAAAPRAPLVRTPAPDPAPKSQDGDLTFPGGRK